MILKRVELVLRLELAPLRTDSAQLCWLRAVSVSTTSLSLSAYSKICFVILNVVVYILVNIECYKML